MRSKKLLASYKTLKYWSYNFRSSFWNHGWRLFDTAEQQERLRTAEQKVMEAQKILDELYGPEIGKAILSELK